MEKLWSAVSQDDPGLFYSKVQGWTWVCPPALGVLAQLFTCIRSASGRAYATKTLHGKEGRYQDGPLEPPTQRTHRQRGPGKESHYRPPRFLFGQQPLSHPSRLPPIVFRINAGAARERVAKIILTDQQDGYDTVVKGESMLAFSPLLCVTPPMAKSKGLLIRKAKGLTPPVSLHSGLSYGITLANVTRTTKEYPTNRSEANKWAGSGLHSYPLLKCFFLVTRDNHICIAGGAIDHHSWSDIENFENGCHLGRY